MLLYLNDFPTLHSSGDVQQAIGVRRRHTAHSYLPHATSSSFSVTNTMFLSCSRVDERRCSLGETIRIESEEKRYLQRTKKDFCEAMRPFLRLPAKVFA